MHILGIEKEKQTKYNEKKEMPKNKKVSYDDNNKYDLRKEKQRLSKTHLGKNSMKTRGKTNISDHKNIMRRSRLLNSIYTCTLYTLPI